MVFLTEFDEISAYIALASVTAIGLILNLLRVVAGNSFLRHSCELISKEHTQIKSNIYKLLREKYCGLRLSTWDKLCEMNLILVIGIGTISCVLAGYTNCPDTIVMNMVLVTLMAILIIGVFTVLTSQKSKVRIVTYSVIEKALFDKKVEDDKKIIKFSDIDAKREASLKTAAHNLDNNLQGITTPKTYEEMTQQRQPIENEFNKKEALEEKNSTEKILEQQKNNEKIKNMELINKALVEAIYESALEKLALQYTKDAAKPSQSIAQNIVNKPQNNQHISNNKMVDAILKEMLQQS